MSIIHSFNYHELTKNKEKLISEMMKTGFIRIQFDSDDDQFKGIHTAVKRFFQLSSESKQESMKNQTNMKYYGYFPSKLDGKEGLDIPHLALQPSEHVLANQITWPKDYDKQEIACIYAYYTFVHELAMLLLDILYPKIQIQETLVNTAKNLSMLRFNYYPTHEKDDIPLCKQDNDGDEESEEGKGGGEREEKRAEKRTETRAVKLACESHIDSSLITILYQDDVGGLQIQDPITKQWLDVECIENSLIINTGKLLGMMSNHQYIPVNHRVLFNLQERISIPYFVYPHYDTVIDQYAPSDYCTDENKSDNHHHEEKEQSQGKAKDKGQRGGDDEGIVTCGDYLIASLPLFKEYDYITALIHNKKEKAD